MAVVVVVVQLAAHFAAVAHVPQQVQLRMPAVHPAVVAAVVDGLNAVLDGVGVVVLGIHILADGRHHNVVRQPLLVAQVGTDVAEGARLHLCRQFLLAVMAHLPRADADGGRRRCVTCRDKDVVVVADGQRQVRHVVQ